jgi:hypothetical protein
VGLTSPRCKKQRVTKCYTRPRTWTDSLKDGEQIKHGECLLSQFKISYFYGCETRSVTLRKEHRLRVYEKRVLRRIFGPNRGE